MDGLTTGADETLAVIAFGVMWLLSKMGIVALAPFWQYWPSVVIVVGVCNLFQRGQGFAHRVFAAPDAQLASIPSARSRSTSAPVSRYGSSPTTLDRSASSAAAGPSPP